MAKISACIIMKNESAMLETCLKSIEGADEIIVVDTGSVDDSVEIAKKYADRVEFFEWCDDFSKARNYAKSFATNDWILSIDCDEIIESDRGIERIKALIDAIDPSVDAIAVTMWNGADSRNFLTRVFKKELEWKGAIHETVTGRKTGNSDLVFRYGRSPAHDLDPELDLRILRNEHERNPECTRTMFYLGRELFYFRKYEEAIRILEEYRTKSVYVSELTYALYLLAKCYWFNQQGQKARDTVMWAIARNPNFKAALNLMSEMTFEPSKSRWKSFAEIADDTNCLFTS